MSERRQIWDGWQQGPPPRLSRSLWLFDKGEHVATIWVGDGGTVRYRFPPDPEPKWRIADDVDAAKRICERTIIERGKGMSEKHWRPESADLTKELIRMLDWPIDEMMMTFKNPAAARAHHAGRVRTLVWAVTGQDFDDDVLEHKEEIHALLEKKFMDARTPAEKAAIQPLIEEQLLRVESLLQKMERDQDQLAQAQQAVIAEAGNLRTMVKRLKAD